MRNGLKLEEQGKVLTNSLVGNPKPFLLQKGPSHTYIKE